jgi:hypothetical protein
MSTNYEKFIAANQALMDCYASVPAEQYSAMSQNDQQQVCKNEAAAVRDFITSNKVTFRSILAERIAAFDAKQ